MTQLGLDGSKTTHPLRMARPLTRRQRELVAYMRAHGVVRPREIGRMMHAGRQYTRRTNCVCMAGTFCQYASGDGFDALRRLERRGLVERVARGQWRVVERDEAWT